MNAQAPSVVIYVNGASCADPGTGGGGQSVGELSAHQLVEATQLRRRFDPHKVHRQFPERWQRYIRSQYRSLAHVCQVFDVSEKTARNWWNGTTGAVGGHVAVAVQEHPVEAPRMLFAAE
ncbi:hypothetical protein [Roseovarius ramblicola]|uniref:Helix-turn-helix domain-containing protein n=1 Tax=Roseovarius ramblicola TaxID=2022336 RepID=A0ABV5HYP6_9RHOB